jgi:hypothetical protein
MDGDEQWSGITGGGAQWYESDVAFSPRPFASGVAPLVMLTKSLGDSRLTLPQPFARCHSPPPPGAPRMSHRRFPIPNIMVFPYSILPSWSLEYLECAHRPRKEEWEEVIRRKSRDGLADDDLAPGS